MGTEEKARTYQFGDFELDLGAHQLRLRDKPVRLERRPLELLVLMVSRHGMLVTREEIIERLWPGNVVIEFDTGLNTLVRKVRQALGDSSDQPVYIETVAGLGYRFIAPVRRVDASSPPTVTSPGVAPKAKGFRWIRVSVITGIVLFVTAISFEVWRAASPERQQTSIAVLPFENLTGRDDFDYLAAGLAEETSTSLAQIDLPHLAVIGGVSAMVLANSTLPIQQIGRDNDIDFFVQSSLRLEQTRIRVTSRLIRAADSKQVWTASFDRELTNVLGLQRELSVAIAEQVRQRLSPDVTATIDRRQTQNPEAYQLYLKGRYEWTQFLPTSIPRALQYYRQAVAIDPGYALAWAGIAHALITSPVTVQAQAESVMPAAQDALQQALEFGPDLAETQLALGSFYFFLDWNAPPAEAAARQAVALDPNSAMSHMFLGMVLSHEKKHVEAREMLRRARELDPLFPLMFANSAVVALAANDAESAIEFAKQAIAINPEFWVGYLHLGSAELVRGNYDAALHAYSEAERLSGGSSTRAIASRAYALAKLGRRDEARNVLEELSLRADDRYTTYYAFAIVYAALDEVDQAFESLDRTLAAHDTALLGVEKDQLLESLHADPRFASLLRRCGCTAGSGGTL